MLLRNIICRKLCSVKLDAVSMVVAVSCCCSLSFLRVNASLALELRESPNASWKHDLVFLSVCWLCLTRWREERRFDATHTLVTTPMHCGAATRGQFARDFHGVNSSSFGCASTTRVKRSKKTMDDKYRSSVYCCKKFTCTLRLSTIHTRILDGCTIFLPYSW